MLNTPPIFPHKNSVVSWAESVSGPNQPANDFVHIYSWIPFDNSMDKITSDTKS